MLESLNNENTIIVLGRAHSGTRILPQALIEAGVFMGEPLNIATDLLPAEPMYEACRSFGDYVDYTGDHTWDFTRALHADIPSVFRELMEEYLTSLIHSEHRVKGWKIPNNNFVYPWLTRLFPNARYVHWIRHPEGSCSKMTGVDRLEKWNVPCKKYLFHEWNYKVRVASWKYHYDIVAQTPRPKHFLQLRYEDYILDQDTTRSIAAQFTGLDLPALELETSKAGPFTKTLARKYPFLAMAMDQLSYQ